MRLLQDVDAAAEGQSQILRNGHYVAEGQRNPESGSNPCKYEAVLCFGTQSTQGNGSQFPPASGGMDTAACPPCDSQPSRTDMMARTIRGLVHLSATSRDDTLCPPGKSQRRKCAYLSLVGQYGRVTAQRSWDKCDKCKLFVRRATSRPVNAGGQSISKPVRARVVRKQAGAIQAIRKAIAKDDQQARACDYPVLKPAWLQWC
jgi:hypothetical protein